MVETTKKYYLGGYYLLKLRSKNYGTEIGSLISTCSDCINDHLLDNWSYSWIAVNNLELVEVKRNYQLMDHQIAEIRNWVDNKLNENKIGFSNVFTDIETAYEYKNKFFSHLNDIKLFALYFDQDGRAEILERFKPQSEENGEIGLRLTLLKALEEKGNEEFLGYDYIGIEISGNFHTFHCHDLGKELSDKFNLTINDYKLFDSEKNSQQVLNYLNEDENGCEPVPWFLVKTKLVTNE